MEQSNISATSANPTAGMEGHARVGIIATLIESARRQENLIDALTTAVDSGETAAILQAAKKLAANRRRPTPLPRGKPGRKKRDHLNQTSHLAISEISNANTNTTSES